MLNSFCRVPRIEISVSKKPFAPITHLGHKEQNLSFHRDEIISKALDLESELSQFINVSTSTTA